jgi:molybdopterin synthase sulfur carrier subunit
MSREIRIAWFGRLADRRGLREEVVETNAQDVAALFAELNALHGLNAELGNLSVAVNDEFTTPEHTLRAGDKVVFMPPFAGG